MANFPKNLQKKLSKRHKENALRQLDSKSGLVDFSSNDYLGFSGEKIISKMALEIMDTEKMRQNGATGSRLLSGNHELYTRLEANLSEWYKSQSALVFNSGYDANLGFFSTVPQKGDFILYDEFCHASIRDGIQLSHAKAYKFKHNSRDDLERKLDAIRSQPKNAESEIYVSTESVFSMDGDSPDLKALASFCQEHHLHLVVDEAHALGVFGRGLVQEGALKEQVFARIITFGKGLGIHGAAVLGSSPLKDFLVNFCRSFVYTTGLPPHTLASILAASQLLESSYGEQSVERLKNTIVHFKKGILKNRLGARFIPSDSAIQSCVVAGNDEAKHLAHSLEEKGFDVRPILSPTVPEGAERLRFCLHAFNTKEEISKALEVVKKHFE